MPPPAEGFAARLVIGPALRAQPDRRLVKLVRDGYESAFEEIVRRYGKPLHRYAAAIVGGHAEDVTQDAFSKALLAMRRDGNEIELRPWLFRIVRNTALNDLRDSPASAEELAEALVGGGPSAAEELERREELSELMRRLRALPEPQRAAIVMRELEGLSHDEIAAALGLSGGGARQAIYRARQALREGAALLLPVSLLKAMLGGISGAPVDAAAGAAGIAGGAGVGVGLKAATATVLVAGAVGAGVAIEQGPHGGHAERANAQSALAPDPRLSNPASTVIEQAASESDDDYGSPNRSERDEGRGEDDAARGDDHSGQGRGGSAAGDDGGGDRTGSRDDHEGRGGPSERGDFESDDSPRSGQGDSGPSGSGGGFDEDDDHSGPGSGEPSQPESDSDFDDGLNSNSGPGSGEDLGDSGSDGGGSGSGSGESSDSHDGDGFSSQMEPQPQEER